MSGNRLLSGPAARDMRRLALRMVFVGLAALGGAANAAAAITHVGAGAVATRNNCGSITPGIPAGAVDDVLVALVNSRESSATVTMTGWNLAYQATHPGRDFEVYVYWRRATSAAANGDPNTIAQSGTCSSIAGQIARFSGVDLVQPFESDPIPGGNVVIQNSNNIDTGTQTTTVDGSMLLVASFIEDNNNVTEGAGWNQSFDTALNVSRDLGLALAYQVQTTAGTASISDWSIGATDRNFGIIFALRPSVVPALEAATLVCGTTNQVEVLFSAPVTAATAENPANYALDGGATVSVATLGADNRVVTLTTSALLSGQLYTLTVNNIATPSGGVIAANSQTTFFSEGGYLSGLLGTYFDQMNLTGGSAQRIDGPLDFDWGAGTPGVIGIGADNFSVRWTGFVTPPVTGNYTFRTRSDDGVRLYINGNLVIDNWTDHGPTDNDSAAIALTAGQRYSVVMAYYENGGGAVAQLSWSGPSTGGFQFIPRSALSHFCGAPRPAAFYKLDEGSWAAAGDVIDSSGNGLHGTAINGALPVPAQVCNGAQLNSAANRYIQVGGLSGLLNATASLAFWIRTTQTGNDLGWQAPGVTGVELSGGADDIFWGWLDASGRIGISVANDFTTKSTVAINNGAWRHVVLTRDHVAGTYQIYIDGVLNTSGAIATGVIGTAFSSLGRIEDTGGTPEYLNGDLDEIRIYGQVLSDAEVVAIRDITRPCPSFVDHIRIEHNGTGLTCEPASVTVKACSDALCSTLYGGNVTTTLSPAGWVGGDTINFTGSTVAQLRRTVAGVVTLGAGTTAPAPVNATQCFNGATPTCDLDFKDTGFLFSAIPAQTAGTVSATHTLQAVRTDTATGACTGLFTGNVPNVELAFQCNNPGTCQAGQLVTFNNNGSGTIAANNSGPVGSWTTRTLSFGADSTASFTFSYPDVGAIRLHARYDINGSGDYMSGASSDFVVRPAGFAVTGIQRTSDGFANPGAADAGGAVFMKAGEDITLTVTALNSQLAATPNYGKEIAAEGVRLTTTLAPGLGLISNPAPGNGTIPGGSFSAGAATVTGLTWGEAGIIRITPGVGDGDYLGAGDVTGATTGDIGRFTPHHFDASPNAPLFATACTAGGFTYVGQPFVYGVGMEPVLTVTARNLAGGTTQNYRGTSPATQAFFRITNGTLTGKAYTAASGTIDASGVTAPDPAIADNGNGTATLTFNSGSGLFFTRTTPVIPFNAEISLAINVIDADSVAYPSNPARFGQASAGNGIAFSTGKEMRFGRLRLIGASGSPLLPLDVPFEAQHWTGTFFATNTLDTCTTVAGNHIGLDNYIGSLNSGNTSVTAVSALSGGRGEITLGAPGAGNSGSVDLAINLGSGANAAACPAFTPATVAPGQMPWLRGQWCGGAFDRDPAARVRIGIGSGSDERIYMRENY